MLDLCKNLDEYLATYGEALGSQVMSELKPLHDPATDQPVDISIYKEGRKPFEPQAHVAAATVKMLNRQNSGFLVCEQGSGKTIMSVAVVHEHAQQHDPLYRVIVMCPDHLIEKWVREIETTLPGVDVMTFENWKTCTKLINQGVTCKRTINATSATARKLYDVNVAADYIEDDYEFTTQPREAGCRTLEQERKLWIRPQRPQWVILGRNQSKFNPNWKPIGQGEFASLMVERRMRVGKTAVMDEHGRQVRNSDGCYKWKTITKKLACCPRCARPILGKDKQAVTLDEVNEKQTNCKSLYLQQVSEDSEKFLANKKSTWKTQGLDRLTDPEDWRHIDNLKPGRIVKIGDRRYEAKLCNEPLWQWIKQPYRWPPAKIIHKKLGGLFRYLIIDEVHEQKSDTSAQSMAAGKLMAATNKVLALTGTLIGGYANHLFPLLVRMSPKTLVKDEGFKWGESIAFSQRYGRVDTIITQKSEGLRETSVGKSQTGMGRKVVSPGSTAKRIKVMPGILPDLFGKHLLGNAIFLSLDEMDASLPRLINHEITDPNDPEFPGAGPISLDMEPDLQQEYDRIERILRETNNELLKTGSTKLLGATLHTLLDYPDRPYGWEPKYGPDEFHPDPSLAVGYHARPELPKIRDNWVDVVQPGDLDRTVIRAKEAALIDICLKEKKKGRQVWVYCMMTGKRDITPRLANLLSDRGLTATILRSTTVPLKEREQWIAENGKGCDVMLSHPQLVSTGLDLFDKGGGHNFSTIVFYETGYNLFTMRQAERRAWRIAQTRECLVYYLFYKGTMQERAMALMAKKMVAARSIDGKFTTEGLLSLAGDENAQMSLVRSMSEAIKTQGRAWRRFGEDEHRETLLPFPLVNAITEEGMGGHTWDEIEAMLDSFAELGIDIHA